MLKSLLLTHADKPKEGLNFDLSLHSHPSFFIQGAKAGEYANWSRLALALIANNAIITIGKFGMGNALLP